MKNGIKPGDSNQITREYFDSLLLEMRHIDNVKPSAETIIFGKKYSTPIMTAALSHLDKFCPNQGTLPMVNGAKAADAVFWTGMGSKEELEDIIATGIDTVKIIKPYADIDMIYEKIEHAEKHGALAIGMDLDHSFNGSGDYDVVHKHIMEPKGMKELKNYISATKLPFIVKGVLSVTDAKKCVDMGAKGIVVSHHHGILNYCVPPLMVLPDIAAAVKGEISIFVDCGIINGYDVFKALALGADAVCAGRVLMDSLKIDGEKGVELKIKSMTNELLGIMARTGFGTPADINSDVIHYYG